MAENISESANIVCCPLETRLCICYIDHKERLVEVMQHRDKGKEFKKRVLDERKMKKNMLKIITTGKGKSLLFYKSLNTVYWICLDDRD